MTQLWKRAALGVALAVTLGTAASAQLAVEIEATAEDAIGRRLAFYLRDEIGKSGTFSEVTSAYKTGFKVSMVTLDPYEKGARAGTSTVYSFVILAKNDEGWDYFLTTYVGVCVNPQECAKSLFGALGEQAEELRQARLKR